MYDADPSSVSGSLGNVPSYYCLTTVGKNNAQGNSLLLFFNDNEATVNIISKGLSSVPFINRFMRGLVRASVRGSSIIHIPGLNDKIADSLSRLKPQKFCQM